MKVAIDDMRNEPGVDIIARTYLAGYVILTTIEIDELILDHDLGSKNPNDDGYRLIKTCLAKMKKLPIKIIVVTSNTVGRQNITNILTEHGYIGDLYNYEFVLET